MCFVGVICVTVMRQKDGKVFSSILPFSFLLVITVANLSAEDLSCAALASGILVAMQILSQNTLFPVPMYSGV